MLLRILIFVAALLVFADAASCESPENINDRIKKAGGRWVAGHTTVSGLSSAELTQKLLSSEVPILSAPAKPAVAFDAATIASLPAHLDWSTTDNPLGQSVVTPVKDQGRYGSCWAHANAAVLESFGLRQNGLVNPQPYPGINAATFDLSEQTMIACTSGVNSYNYMQDTGLPSEACYPYIAGPGTCATATTNCPNWESSAYRIGGWGSIAPNPESLKTALNLYGPIVTDFYPDGEFFFYSSGIFSTTGYYPVLGVGHAVELVGYNDQDQYFRAKNSWGTGWGESGFFRIAYSEISSQLKFGVGSIAFVNSCTHSVSPESASFDFHGGVGSIAVTSVPDICSWRTQHEWSPMVFITSGAYSEIGTGTVEYDVTENFEETAREHLLTVAGKTVTISQSGRPKHRIFVYWEGTGRGELVIKETWQGRSTYHSCDTFVSPPGGVLCDTTVLDGAMITLTARGFPGTGTAFTGYSNRVPGAPLPCTNDTGGGECTFAAHGFQYLSAIFSDGSVTPTPVATATSTPDGPSSRVAVLAPTEGASLRSGRSASIRFHSDSSGVFQIDVLRKGKRAATVSKSFKGKAGNSTVLWKIPTAIISGSDYRIRVVKKGCADCTGIGAPFTIIGKGLVITAPAAGSLIIPGSQVKIGWRQGGGLCSTVKLQLLPPSGAPVVIQPKLKSKATGSYRWNVPPALQAGSGYRLKLSCIGAPGQTTGGELTVSLAATETPAPPTPVSGTPTPQPTSTPSPVVTAPNALSIALLGLGDSELVTTSSNPLLHGHAQASRGIAAITCSNARTGQTAGAAAVENWQVNVALQAGDNPITCRLLDTDGASVEQPFVLVYHTQQIFSSPLELSDDVAFIQEANDLTAAVSLKPGVTASAIGLVRTDSSGIPVATVSSMADDGITPDEVTLDRTYSAAFALTPAASGSTCYRVRATVSGTDYLSESRCVWATTHLTDSDLNQMASIGQTARETFIYLVSTGKSFVDAAASVAATLRGTTGVAEAGSNGIDGVWWVTEAGLFGGYSGFSPGNKSTDPENEVQSPKGVIISPYIDNPRYSSAESFGNNDDFYTAWDKIRHTPQCNLYCSDSFKNIGENKREVRVSTFKKLGEWGYIHISSHGNIYYNGLLNKWRDEWGQDLHNTLRAYSAANGIHTGFRLELLPDLTWRDKSIYEKDLKAGRMALFDRGNGGNIEPFLMAGFFRKYLGPLPNSIVILSTCYSMFNQGLADAFLQNGAAAVVGYTMPVRVIYAGNTTTTIATKLLEGKSIKEAFDAAVAAHGQHDGNDPPAYIRLSGNDNAVINQGGVKNGDFESGKLAPWKREEGTRAFVLPEFAGIAPQSSTHFAYLTTGPGASNSAGIITQAVCMPPGVDPHTLTFKYRYLSQEFDPADPFAAANDVMLATICPIDFWSDQIMTDCASTGVTWSQNSVTLNATPLVEVSGLTSGADKTYATSTWLSGSQLLAPGSAAIPVGNEYNGQSISLSLWAADSGPNLSGDTTILIDDVKIE